MIKTFLIIMGIGIAAFCILFAITLCVIFIKYSKIKRECDKKIRDARKEADIKIAKAKDDATKKIAKAKENSANLIRAANKWSEHMRYGQVYVETLRKSGVFVMDEEDE